MAPEANDAIKGMARKDTDENGKESRNRLMAEQGTLPTS
jgi:hypothetical protein